MIGCAGLLSLAIIFFGVLFLLESLGISDNAVGRFWPLIIIFFGLASLINLIRFRARIHRFRRRWPPDID